MSCFLNPLLFLKPTRDNFLRNSVFLNHRNLLFLSTNSFPLYAGSVKAAFFSAACRVSTYILQNLPELRFNMTTSAVLDHIDLHKCKRRGIKVVNAGSISSEDVAYTVVGLLIDDWFDKSCLWYQKGDYPLGHKLGGKQVRIIEMESIGLDVAKRLNAFSCIISYTSRNKIPHVTFPFCSNIQKLVVNCEILIIFCALTDQTRHIIDKSVMLALGKNGIIVNLSRGAIINEKDLVQCLLKGEITGVGLDVFENEPDVPAELF